MIITEEPCRDIPIYNKKVSRYKKRNYRLLPLVLAGVIPSLLLLSLGVFLYAVFCYFTYQEAAASVFIIIYTVSLSAGLFVISMILNGTSLKPQLISALIFFTTGLLWGNFNLTSFFLRLLLSLACILPGHLLAMFLCRKKLKEKTGLTLVK